MQETEFAFFNLESGAPTGGPLTLRGWVWPKPGWQVVDVRARTGGQIWPGVHGIPREDLAAHFQTGRRFALAEFNVVAIARAPELVLEVLLLDGTWRSLAVYPCAGGPRENVLPSAPPLRWHEYGRMLEQVLRAARAEAPIALAELARRTVARLPQPRTLRHPPLPFHGHLDEPAAFSRCGFGRTAVIGWLFHGHAPIKRVLGTFDLQAWQTLTHGLASPGPGAVFPTHPAAARAGLFGILDVPAQLPDPATLRLYAELADGHLQLCAVQRAHLITHEEEKAPYGAVTVADADQHLQAALAEAGLPLTRDDEFHREVARIAAEHRWRAVEPGPDTAPLVGFHGEPARVGPRRVLFVTHNLNYEGAPLWLADLVEHHARRGSQVTVLSPSDGPLRARLEQTGARVALIKVDALFAAADDAAAHVALAQIRAAFDFAATELVIANTFTTFWAVHAAHAAGVPVLLYVHESTTPAGFYHGRMAAAVIGLVHAAFTLADRIAFTTAATRDYHLGYGRPDRHRLVPGWIEVARLDQWRETHPRASLRAKFNLQSDEWLVSNVGTVCDRKGQHIFARAVDLLWQRHPDLARRTRFVMLGGGQTPFDQTLADLLTQIDRPNLTVHPATADYLPYYGAADLFVCSTYEESSPRVILENMALGTPILSSSVQGVPEQVRPEVEALLVPAGDTLALADAMARLLRDPGLRAQLAAAARERVVRAFDSRILLPRHLALADDTAQLKAST